MHATDVHQLSVTLTYDAYIWQYLYFIGTILLE